MDKKIVERYEDAAVALFMEEYADAEAEALLAELAGAPDEEFPEELDQKCQALIRRKFAQERRKVYWKRTEKVLSRVAVFAIALLALFSVAFMTVEAVRIPIINFYLERHGEYTKITGEEETTPSEEETSVPACFREGYLEGLLPEEYSLLTKEIRPDGECFAVFTGADGETISLTSTPSEYALQIDTEGADVFEECRICDIRALFVVKDGYKTLTWIDDSGSMFALGASGLEKQSMIEIAKKITFEK